MMKVYDWKLGADCPDCANKIKLFCPTCNRENTFSRKYSRNTEMMCQDCAGVNPFGKWLTTPTAEPWFHCVDCNSIWRSNRKVGYSERNVQILQATEKYCPECAKTPKRYCPNCNGMQKIKANAHPRESVNCKNCGNPAWASSWLTSPTAEPWFHCPVCRNLWKTNLKQTYTEERAQILQATEKHCPSCEGSLTRFCRHCNNQQFIPPYYFDKGKELHVMCNACHKKEKAGDWRVEQLPEWLAGDDPLLPAPPPAAAPEPEWVVKFCPYCGNQARFLKAETNFNAMGCGKCGKVIVKGGWLEQPPKEPQPIATTRQITTPRLCPECHKPQDVLQLWLENQQIMAMGLLKCEQCGKQTHLHRWQPPAAEVARASVWSEEDLRHWRGELKKMFGGLVNEFCTSEGAWSTFDQVLLKIRHHLTTQEPSHLAEIDQLLTPPKELPERDKVITWAEVEAETQQNIIKELSGLSLGQKQQVLAYISRLKGEN